VAVDCHCCRNYQDSARHEKVRAFYEEQHSKMTYAFVEHMEQKYLGLNHFKMGIWSAEQWTQWHSGCQAFASELGYGQPMHSGAGALSACIVHRIPVASECIGLSLGH